MTTVSPVVLTIVCSDVRKLLSVHRLIENQVTNCNKNSSGDVNVNFYAVRPEATQIRWNNAK